MTETEKPIRILIWSINGDVGKSSMSLNFHYIFGMPIITNDKYSNLTKIITKIIQQDGVSKEVTDTSKLMVLGEKDKIPQIPKEHSIIFDYAGGINKDEERIVNAIKQVDCVIIPTIYADKDENKYRDRTEETIQELYEAKRLLKLENLRSIVVINKYGNEKEFEEEKKYFLPFKKEGMIDEILKLKTAKAMKDIKTKKKSVKDIMNSFSLFKRSYGQVNEDFDTILNFINS